MSDEEELQRYANSYANSPLGEVMVDFTPELQELGLRVDE